METSRDTHFACIASEECEDHNYYGAPDESSVRMADVAKTAVALLNAYPMLRDAIVALEAEREALREVVAAAEAYRAAREGMHGGRNAEAERSTRVRLIDAIWATRSFRRVPR